MRYFFLLLCLLPLTLAWAGAVEGPEECVRCGMLRTFFDYSRAQVSYADGSSAGTCSLHCAVEDLMKSPGKKVTSLKVADYDSKKLIDAKNAVWVVGGKVRGVMTDPAKWAFSTQGQARKFVEANGGSITSFDQVYQSLRTEVEEMDKPAEAE